MKKVNKPAKTTKLRDVNGFSDFFYNATPEERQRVLREVVRKANEDQAKLYSEYGKVQA